MIEALDIARPLIMKWEGFHKAVRIQDQVYAKPYLCPALKWTIGYGTLCSKDQAPIDEPTARLWLNRYMLRDAHSVVGISPNLITSSPERFGAVLSWTYNLGLGNYRASTMRRCIDNDDWEEAARQCMRWVFAGGRRLPGLVARRAEEAALMAKD